MAHGAAGRRQGRSGQRGGLRRHGAAAALLLAVAAGPLPAAEVGLLADLNTVGRPAVGFARFQEASAVLDDRWFLFVGDDGVSGEEPWSLDLTTGELVRLADIAEGAADSRPEQFTPIGTLALFVAASHEAGQELWVTDGTPAGTHQVEDIFAGAEDSDVLELFRIPGNRAVFRADDGVHGAELWVSDGTEAGTSLVADIRAGADASSPGSFAFAAGALFFYANDGTHGSELWKTSGAVTSMVLDIEPGAGSSSPNFLYSVGGRVVFRATRAVDGSELWQSDGSAAGTSIVADIHPAGSSYPANFYYHAGLATLFFTADNGTHGFELFKLALGVATRLTDLNPGSASASPNGLAGTPTRLLFTAVDGAPGTRLFAWDGVGVSSLETLATSGVPNRPEFVTEWNGHVYLRHGTCWRSDGTSGGTVDFGYCLSGPAFAVGDGRLVFGDTDGGEDELWSLDAAHAIAQETDFASLSSDPQEPFWFGDLLFFSADDGVHGRELWVWDRLAGGAPALIDIDPGPDSSAPSGFTAFEGEVWFSADSASTGTELWRSVGTASGTVVYEVEPGSSGVYPGKPVVVGGTLFVSTDDSGVLYRIPSAVAAPEPIEFAGDSALYADELLAHGGELAFVTWTPSTGQELFTLGETAVAPVAHELVAGPDDGSVDEEELVSSGGALYFAGDDDGFDNQVWRLSGGVLEVVSALDPGAYPDELAAGPGGVYLAADDASAGREIHFSNGASTVPLADIAPGDDDSYPAEFTAAGGRIYFRADDDVTGYELWWTDGSTVEPFADVLPGEGSSYPTNLTAAGDRLLFTADDGSAGEEIFLTLPDSAARLPQVLPGPASVTPRELAASSDGCLVIFSAAHPELGREPYLVELCLFVDGFESGTAAAWHLTPPS